MRLEYVLSGLTMGAGPVYSREDAIKDYPEKYFNPVIDRLNKGVVKVSLLYNAHTERKHGETTRGRMSFNRFFSDSGGLQMITTKRGITEELKEKVYNHQGRYSDVAMSFDEIPVMIDNDINTDGINDVLGKRFVYDWIIPKADETADNIIRQLEVFDELKSETKVMIISQGLDVPTRNLYLDTILDKMRKVAISRNYESDYYVDKIYGVAISSVCLGTGLTERLQMAYDVRHLNLPEHIKKNVHLLGVGNVGALLPYILNPEYFDFIETLSFDSSSHAGKYHFKSYIFEDMTSVDMNKDKEFAKRALTDIYEKNVIHYNDMGCTDLDHMIERGSKFSPLNVDDVRKFKIDGCDISELVHDTMPFMHVTSVIENFNKQLDIVVKVANKIQLTNDENKIYRKILSKYSEVFREQNRSIDYETPIDWLSPTRVKNCQTEEEARKEIQTKDLYKSNVKNTLKDASVRTDKLQEEITIGDEWL